MPKPRELWWCDRCYCWHAVGTEEPIRKPPAPVRFRRWLIGPFRSLCIVARSALTRAQTVCEDFGRLDPQGEKVPPFGPPSEYDWNGSSQWAQLKTP